GLFGRLAGPVAQLLRRTRLVAAPDLLLTAVGPRLDRDGLASLGRLPHHLAGGLVGDPLAFGPLLAGVAGLLLGQLGLALDVDAPARQPGGQAGVLALLADRQGQLVVVDDDDRRPRLLVQADVLDLGRLQRTHHELGGLLRERDDVHLLAPELVGHHADTGATGADASAHRVDVGVVRPDGDLGAVAGL